MVKDSVNSDLLAHVIGRKVQKLREAQGLTQDELARRMVGAGAEVTKSTVAALENGRRIDIGLGETVVIAKVFGIRLADLVPGAGPVRLNLQSEIARAELRGLLEGKTARTVKVAQHIPPGFEADRVAAAQLEVPIEVVLQSAHMLWGQNMTAERDKRVDRQAEDDASPRRKQAIRGHVTRVLMKELQSEMEREQ